MLSELGGSLPVSRERVQATIGLTLLVPTIEWTLVHHPVGKGVDNVRNDGAESMEAIAIQGGPGLNSLSSDETQAGESQFWLPLAYSST